MKEIVRTALEISWSILVFVASVAGLSWLLQVYLGLSWEGTILLLTPTVLLGALAAIYGYYMGWQRRRAQEGHPLPTSIFQLAFRFFVFLLLLLFPASLAVYFLYLRDFALTGLFAIITGLIALWAIPRLVEHAKDFGVLNRNP